MMTTDASFQSTRIFCLKEKTTTRPLAAKATTRLADGSTVSRVKTRPSLTPSAEPKRKRAQITADWTLTSRDSSLTSDWWRRFCSIRRSRDVFVHLCEIFIVWHFVKGNGRMWGRKNSISISKQTNGVRFGSHVCHIIKNSIKRIWLRRWNDHVDCPKKTIISRIFFTFSRKC